MAIYFQVSVKTAYEEVYIKHYSKQLVHFAIIAILVFILITIEMGCFYILDIFNAK